MIGLLLKRSLQSRECNVKTNSAICHLTKCFLSSILDRVRILKMPALSPTMETGTVKKFAVSIGSKIAPSDMIAEVETDKSVMDWESTETGVIAKFLAKENEIIEIGKPVIVLAESEHDLKEIGSMGNEDFTDKKKSSPEPTKESFTNESSKLENPQENNVNTKNAVENIVKEKNGGGLRATPAAKAYITENRLDVSSLRGSGSGGAITLDDVKNIPAPNLNFSSQTSTFIKNSMMRKTIAKRCVESKTTIPHYYLNIEPEIDRLLSMRRELNENQSECKISMTDLLIKIIAQSCRHVPLVNAKWSEDEIEVFSSVDVSVAVATADGLVAPVIKSAHQKSLREINVELKDLAKRAREGGLKPDEYQGGTISISNLGMSGIDSFTAIINQPQSAILSIGQSKKSLKMLNSANDNSHSFKEFTKCSVTMGCDHRVIDGAVGAEFLKHVRNYIENPSLIAL